MGFIGRLEVVLPNKRAEGSFSIVDVRGHPNMFGHKFVIMTALHNLFKSERIKGIDKILAWAREAKMELGPY